MEPRYQGHYDRPSRDPHGSRDLSRAEEGEDDAARLVQVWSNPRVMPQRENRETYECPWNGPRGSITPDGILTIG